MKQSEIKSFIKAASESTEKSIRILSGATNPIVDSILDRATGYHQALTDVLDLINNNPMYIKIETGV